MEGKFADLPKGDPNERQRRRQQQLEAMARLAGWDSWSEFVTALKNGEVEFPRKSKPVNSEIIHKPV